MIASPMGSRKLENEAYNNQEKPTKASEVVNQRKSRRKAGKLPERYDPLYPDMETVGKEMANSDSEEELDLTNEYTAPDRADR